MPVSLRKDSPMKLPHWRWSPESRTLADELRDHPRPINDEPHQHFHGHGGMHVHTHRHPEDHAHSSRRDLPAHD